MKESEEDTRMTSMRDPDMRRTVWADKAKEDLCRDTLAMLLGSREGLARSVNVACPKCHALPGESCMHMRSHHVMRSHGVRVESLTSLRMAIAYSADMSRLSDFRKKSLRRVVESVTCPICGAARGQSCKWACAEFSDIFCLQGHRERFAAWIMSAAPDEVVGRMLALLDLAECSQGSAFEEIQRIVEESGVDVGRSSQGKLRFGSSWLDLEVIHSYGDVVVLVVSRQELFGFRHDFTDGSSIISRADELASYDPIGTLCLKGHLEASPVMRVGLKDLGAICELVKVGEDIQSDQGIAEKKACLQPNPLSDWRVMGPGADPTRSLHHAPELAWLMLESLKARLSMMVSEFEQVRTIIGGSIDERRTWALEQDIERVKASLGLWVDEVRALPSLEI